MRTRWWLAAIWAAFAVRLAFYATALPIWEGFDEWAHFAVVRHVAAEHALVARDALVPLDVAASLQLAPIPPTISNLPGAVLTHEQFWAAPPQVRAEREARFRSIPSEFAAQSSRLGAYESLQPPVYYWAVAPLLRLLRNSGLATQLFALRWASALIGSLVIPLVFLLGRAVFREDRVALGCAAIAALMPELAITTARVSNECVAIPVYTALTWVAVKRRSWLALGILLGVGLVTKAYFLAAVAGVAVAFWAPRALLVAAAISGWWYVRNLWTTGTLSGLSEAVALRGKATTTLLPSLHSLPWKTAIDSILFSHLYFGGWSSLTARSWMYHLLYLAIAAAAVALNPLRRNREIRSAAYIYGFFWIAQLYNATLIYASKGAPTSMGWYLYAVVGAEVALCVAGLRRLIGGSSIAVGTVLFGLLDLYTMNAVALPYYTGMLGRKANGALAGVRAGSIHPAEMFQRLTAFKPGFVTAGWMAGLWTAYVIATVALIVAGVRLARGVKRV